MKHSSRKAERIGPEEPEGLLWERAYQFIRSDITRCVLPPGAEVTEADLCDRYAIGKTPIRTALNRLAHEGVVQPYLRRGYVVAPVTMKDVEDIYDARAVIEAASARRAVSRIDIDELQAFNAENLSDPFGYINSNAKFHVAIAAYSGNQRLAQITADLMQRATRVIWLGLYASPLPRKVLEQQRKSQVEEHDQIIRALRRQDVDEVERLVIAHIESTRHFIVSALLKRNDLINISTAPTLSL